MIRDGNLEQWRAPEVNETCCKRPQLAKVLRDVAQHGPDVLYTGAYAEGLAKDIQDAGGIITVEDLATADAIVNDAVRGHAMGVDLITAPPPSSGITLITSYAICS